MFGAKFFRFFAIIALIIESIAFVLYLIGGAAALAFLNESPEYGQYTSLIGGLGLTLISIIFGISILSEIAIISLCSAVIRHERMLR